MEAKRLIELISMAQMVACIVTIEWEETGVPGGNPPVRTGGHQTQLHHTVVLPRGELTRRHKRYER